MDFSSSNVESVVLQFYSSGCSQDTNQWLTQAQMSPSAWTWAWDLVSPQKQSEVQFFGANTIAIKLSKFWHEVPADQYEGLRKKILDLLLYYRGAKIVQTRLCVAMASLLIHSIPGQWSNPVDDLVKIFQQHEEGRNLWLLLALLTVIPEEFSTQAMQSQKRGRVRSELVNSLDTVIRLTLHVLEQKRNLGGEAAVQAVKCIQAWIQFGIPIENIEAVFPYLVLSVEDEELYDATLEAMSLIVSHGDTHNYPNMIRNMLKKVLTLEPLFNGFMEERSFDIATPLANLFVVFGETHSRLLTEWALESSDGREHVLRLFGCILSISACNAQYPTEETISEIPFGFWYILQDDIIGYDVPHLDPCIQLFAPVYLTLVDSMLKKSMYRLNENEWTSDQRESFRCYRTDIADTIMYCYSILRHNLLQNLLKHVDEAAGLNQQDPNHNWPYLEAVLYAWSAISEPLAEEEECPILTQFLAKLPVLPYNNNVKVISSALDCIGGFAEWLATHPELIPLVTPIVTAAIHNPELALFATMALKDLSRDCTEAMRPLANEVIEACNSALKSNRLKEGECIRLMYPIGKMLSQLPENEILPRLEPILTPFLIELQSMNSLESNPHTKSKTTYNLKLISSLFQSIDVKPKIEKMTMSNQSTIGVIFPQILPLLQQVAKKWIVDADVVEDLCNLLKNTISALSEAIMPYTQNVVMMLVECYEVKPLGCILELGRLLFILFGNSPTPTAVVMQSFFKHIVDVTLKNISSSGNPSDFSELIAAFFLLLAQIIKKVPNLMVATEGVDLLSLFQCGCGCIGLPESDPVRAASSFLSNYINVSRDHPPLNSIVAHYGEELFMIVIRLLGGHENPAKSSSSSLDHCVEILFAFNKKYFDCLRQWMVNFSQLENFPSPHVTKEQKQAFSQMVLRERVNKRKMAEIVKEFSLVCCGMVDTSNTQMNQVLATWDRIGIKNDEKNKNSTAGS